MASNIDPRNSPASEAEASANPLAHRYKLTIAYDGSEYHGWQKQCPPGCEPLRTVAGVIEEQIRRLVGQPIDLRGASRTDAGVHARGQVAQFDAACRVPLHRLADAINSRLPPDVEVVKAELAPPYFDAITSVRSKQYRYRIYNTVHRPLELRRVVWHGWIDLDVERMNAAAARLVGTHDFAGFAAAGHGRLTTVRTIFNCRVERDPAHAPEVHIVVEGDGFLYNMVRIISGTLVEVGRKRFEPDIIDQVIASGNRAMAGPTLPPEGLWLEWIKY